MKLAVIVGILAIYVALSSTVPLGDHKQTNESTSQEIGKSMHDCIARVIWLQLNYKIKMSCSSI